MIHLVKTWYVLSIKIDFLNFTGDFHTVVDIKRNPIFYSNLSMSGALNITKKIKNKSLYFNFKIVGYIYFFLW